MAVNKLALLRYKCIDECLQNPYRKWTLENLIEKVSEALYEYEGITTGISKRTIQGDIQTMRSDKLGYNAPIIVSKNKYYSYEDANYSITNSPINDQDLGKMKEVVSILKHLSGFDHFNEMNEIVTKLESKYDQSISKNESNIQFEENKLLKGLNFLNLLYQSISKQKPVFIEYKSFKAREASQNIYFPYLLKEHRNRWFLICKAKGTNHLATLALDRIISLNEISGIDYESYQGINFERYYEDTIGVTKNEKDRAYKVTFWINKENLPYIITKPIHKSQVLLKEEADGAILRIDVVLNFELERELLGFGENIKILGPKILQRNIKRRVQKMSSYYFETLKNTDN